MTLTNSETQLLLLHNPRCSKSRAVHAILTEGGHVFTERLYLEDPLSRSELDELRTLLGRPAAEWIRSGEGAYAERGLGAGSSEAEVLDAIAARPELLERPILIGAGRAAVGRPPEAVRELL